MEDLTQNDLTMRLLTLNCCIGRLTNELLVKIKIGSSNTSDLLIELQVLQGMMKIVKKYQVLGGLITETDNCLTETDIQSVFDYMSRKCNNCFQLPGFQYV